MNIMNIQYVDGEKILNPKVINTDITPKIISEDDIISKYKMGNSRIIIEHARYPIDTIPNMIDKNINVSPDYQRRIRWDFGQMSRLIESIIMNIPIPPVFLYEIDYSSYEVMDGLQRLTTIKKFYNNEFPLEELEYWKELEGMTFKKLPDIIQKGIDRGYLSSIILLHETATEDERATFLKQAVFERLNSGGEKLSPQEIRNALYDGNFNQLCIKLSSNNDFTHLWKIPSSSGVHKTNNEIYNSMEDVELILRFFAYRHLDKMKSSMEEFLDHFLREANTFSKSTLKELETIFTSTIHIARNMMGDKAFIIPFKKTSRPVKTIYDPLMLSLSKFTHQLKNLDLRTNLYEKIYLDENKESITKLFDGKYNGRLDVKNRMDFFDNKIKKILGI